MHLAAGQVPEQPAVDGAEGEVLRRPRRRPRAGATRPWCRRSTGRAPGPCDPGPGRGGPRRAARRSGPRCAGPARRWRGGGADRCGGPTPRSVSRWSVIPNAATGSSSSATSWLVTATTAVQISVGVVLDPAGPREVLGELLVAVAGRAALVVDGEGPHPGRACVEGDHDRHAQTVTVGVPSVGSADRAANVTSTALFALRRRSRLQRSVGRHVRWVGLAPPHARHTSANDLRETRDEEAVDHRSRGGAGGYRLDVGAPGRCGARRAADRPAGGGRPSDDLPNPPEDRRRALRAGGLEEGALGRGAGRTAQRQPRRGPRRRGRARRQGQVRRAGPRADRPHLRDPGRVREPAAPGLPRPGHRSRHAGTRPGSTGRCTTRSTSPTARSTTPPVGRPTTTASTTSSSTSATRRSRSRPTTSTSPRAGTRSTAPSPTG